MLAAPTTAVWKFWFARRTDPRLSQSKRAQSFLWALLFKSVCLVQLGCNLFNRRVNRGVGLCCRHLAL